MQLCAFRPVLPNGAERAWPIKIETTYWRPAPIVPQPAPGHA